MGAGCGTTAWDGRRASAAPGGAGRRHPELVGGLDHQQVLGEDGICRHVQAFGT